jgi:hypothetical protein
MALGLHSNLPLVIGVEAREALVQNSRMPLKNSSARPETSIPSVQPKVEPKTLLVAGSKIALRGVFQRYPRFLHTVIAGLRRIMRD